MRSARLHSIANAAWKRRLIQSLITIVVLLAFAAPVLANSSFWSFRMNNLVVNGATNGIWHQMNAGFLTNQGQIWVDSHDAPPFPAAIAEVSIEVWKENGFFPDERVCKLVIVPRDDGVAKQFFKNCQNIPNAQYFIYAWKPYNDGRNIGAQGDIKTN